MSLNRLILKALAVGSFGMSISAEYGWLISDRVPTQDDLVVAKGVVARVEYVRGSTHSSALTGVKFWLPQDSEFFYYGSFLPDFQGVKDFIVPGARVRLDTIRAKHDIWRLEVAGEVLADRDQIVKAHHDNGIWGLAVAIVMALSGGYFLSIDRRAGD
jgi:hypothetical protein